MANKYIYLTSEDFVRSNASINDEVHGKYVQSAMREAQDINLQSLLGTRLMKKLQDLVRDNQVGETGNEIYKELLDRCKYFLLYHTVEHLIPIVGVHISNFGLSQPSDENMTALGLRDTFRMQQYYTDKADFYGKELQDWLIENHSQLPELCAKKISQLHSNLYSAASCGLNLGGARGRGWYGRRCRK